MFQSNSVKITGSCLQPTIMGAYKYRSFTLYAPILTLSILANVKNGKCFLKGSWGADFEDSMKPLESDIIISGKSGLCGFESTNLNFILRQNHIDNVVLAGFLTNCCVESTMRASYEKGFNVITLTDCTAATSLAEQVDSAYFILNIEYNRKQQ